MKKCLKRGKLIIRNLLSVLILSDFSGSAQARQLGIKGMKNYESPYFVDNK